MGLGVKSAKQKTQTPRSIGNMWNDLPKIALASLPNIGPICAARSPAPPKAELRPEACSSATTRARRRSTSDGEGKVAREDTKEGGGTISSTSGGLIGPGAR